MPDMKKISDQEWRTKLTPEQYHIVREKGTEPPGTGIYLENKDQGMYRCIACGQNLFSSNTKFDSGTGWPSFTDSVKDKVDLQPDASDGMLRTEVICKNCGSHLGHVFPDGPGPTGQRYCINSIALDFKQQGEKNE